MPHSLVPAVGSLWRRVIPIPTLPPVVRILYVDEDGGWVQYEFNLFPLPVSIHAGLFLFLLEYTPLEETPGSPAHTRAA